MNNLHSKILAVIFGFAIGIITAPVVLLAWPFCLVYFLVEGLDDMEVSHVSKY